MSQPRRRRRRRRKPTGEAPQKPRQEGAQVREQASELDASGSASSRSRNRRRRRRGAGGGGGIASPKSSEDLVRALPRERPAELTAPPDGQSLDTIIGELQSNYGVPAYPQEYRITIKVAEEKAAGGGGQAAPSKTAPAPEGAPKREKAPAPPRVGPEGEAEEGAQQERPAKRKRSRRRRGRGRSPGASGGSDSGGPSSPPSAPPPPPPA